MRSDFAWHGARGKYVRAASVHNALRPFGKLDFYCNEDNFYKYNMLVQTLGAPVQLKTLLGCVLSLLLGSLPAAQAALSVTLAWDPDPGVVGYRLHYGTSRGRYTETKDVGNTTRSTVWSLTAGETYYFVVTAYNTAGLESEPSNEVSFTATPVRLISPVADFDGDHHTDLLWRDSQSGDVAIWLLDGPSVIQAAVIAKVPLHWKIIGLADMNADGKTDILWYDTTATGQAYAVWYMNGMSVENTQLFSLPVNYPVVFFADLDGKGTVDAVEYQPDSGAVVICPNTGDLTFYAAYQCTVLEGWVLLGLADLNGDGHHELIWRNRSTGEVVAWYLTNFQPSRSVNLFTPSLNWQLRGIGKFNANPSDAFVWYHSNPWANSGTVAIWNFNSAGQCSSSLLGIAPFPWEIYGAGNSEILWYNPNTTQFAFSSVNGTTTTPSAINIIPESTWLVQPLSN